MKIFITLFVLLFSSSVVAGDDLSGKNIFCKFPYTSNSTEILYLIGFAFSKDSVIILSETNTEPLKTHTMSYKTSATYIEITFQNKMYYKINRKTLFVWNSAGINYPYWSCNVVTKPLAYLFIENLEEYKKDNLI